MKIDVKGLHKFCMKCKRLCTNKDSFCGLKKIKAKNCKYKHRHHYQSRIWSSELKKIGNVRTWTGKTFEESAKLHELFKQQCLEKSVVPVVKETKPYLLNQCMNSYIDFLHDADVADHNKKNLSKNHILAYKRYLKRFLEVCGNLNIYAISDHEVGVFHKWIIAQGYSSRTYNDHMICMGSLFEFLIKKDYDLKNPFKEVSKKPQAKNRNIITGEELEILKSVITPENGWDEKAKVNRCYPWLLDSIMLALLTGERRDGIFYLKWEHIQDNYISIPNFKVNRAHGMDEYHHAPITIDLAELLLGIGYGDKEQYILSPDRENRETLKRQATLGFTHFWNKTGIEKKITFRNLRKTYITRIRMVLGDKAKALNIHKSDEVQVNHYINQNEITKELTGVRLF